MKKYLIPITVTMFICLCSFKANEPVAFVYSQEPIFEYDQTVMAIIENKCMGCHNPEARNEKAKAKLQWEKLPMMTKVEVIGMFEEVIETLEEGSMPPQKMLDRNPDKALTKKETKQMRKWFDATADKLLDE